MRTLTTCQFSILAALTLFTAHAGYAESALSTLRQGFMPDVATLSDGNYVVLSQESKNGGGAFIERFNSNNSVVFPRTILPSMETKWNSIQALSNGGYFVSGFIDSDPNNAITRGLGWWELDKSNTLFVGPKRVNEQKSYCGSYGFRDSLMYAANYAVSVTHACGNDWNLYFFVTKLDGERAYDALVSNTPGDQRQAELVQLTDGNVLIAWSDNSGLLDKSGWAVYGRIFSLQSMSFITEQFLINQITQGDQGYISLIPYDEFQELKTFHVVALKNGGFMVAWIDARDGAQTNIYGRAFNNK